MMTRRQMTMILIHRIKLQLHFHRRFLLYYLTIYFVLYLSLEIIHLSQNKYCSGNDEHDDPMIQCAHRMLDSNYTIYIYNHMIPILHRAVVRDGAVSDWELPDLEWSWRFTRTILYDPIEESMKLKPAVEDGRATHAILANSDAVDSQPHTAPSMAVVYDSRYVHIDRFWFTRNIEWLGESIVSELSTACANVEILPNICFVGSFNVGHGQKLESRPNN